MKKTFLLVLFVLATIGLSAQDAGLLKNGSFEEWKKGAPAKWGIYYTDLQADIFTQSKEAHTGSASVRIDFEPKRENDNRRIYSYPTELEAGNYSLTLYLKGEGEFRFVSLTKKGENASSKTTDVSIAGIPAIEAVDSKEWKAYTLNFDIKEADAYQLFICVNEAKKLLIDDVLLTKK